MNFKDLLDEDNSKGTRKCDAWLAKNIECNYGWCHYMGENIFDTLDEVEEVSSFDQGGRGKLPKDEREVITPLYHCPRYTTKNSIDLIFDLACDFVDREEGKIDLCADKGSGYCGLQNYELMENPVKSNLWPDPKLAIAEALFMAYQKMVA